MKAVVYREYGPPEVLQLREVEDVDWDAFSPNLVKAIQSDNEGFQCSAIGMIIRYADYLNAKDARFDVVRIFRSYKESRVRQLAMVTLYHMKDNWAMYFLKRTIKQCIRFPPSANQLL